MSSGGSDFSLSLVDGAGQLLPQSSPFVGNAGYVSGTDARPARRGPGAYPVAVDPLTDAVSISITLTVAPGTRVLVRVGCLGLFFEDELPRCFQAAPGAEVQKLA